MDNNKDNSVSIEWESTGYSVLKNLNSSVLGIFCEFIDNSLQSYKEKKNEILKFDPNYRLKIDISYDDREIVIKDNAGGIDSKNYLRALKPANRADDTTGLNEFGLGMKYAAVWISNEWELISSAIGEEVERSVLFDYEKVITENLKTLPFKEKTAPKQSHYTEVRLRKLESKHVSPFQYKYLKSKIAFIYRNFLRNESSFYSNWKEDYVEFNVFGEKLEWNEYGFLIEQWWKDRQVDFNDNPPVEWKYKFDWIKIPYEEKVLNDNGETILKKTELEISGFVGILPDGMHSGKNGFVLFRRGRVVEGIDSRETPNDISGRSKRAFKYIRLYGELHFRNVDISFDKTKLSINRERRDEVFTVISSLIKNVEFQELKGKKYNLINQADKHRAHFSKPSAKRAIESVNSVKKKEKTKAEIKQEQIIADKTYDSNYDIQLLNEDSVEIKSLPENQTSEILIGSYNYKIILNFTERDDVLYISNEDSINKVINITIGMGYPIFIENPKLYDEANFVLIISFIKTLAISEVKSKNGRNEAKDVRHIFNDYLKLILK